MAIDTPAKLVVVGGGPIGIETALYARFLGYDVAVLERDRLFEHVLAWSDTAPLLPFRKLISPLGKAAILTQDPDHRFPDDHAMVTSRQWLDRYLLPLAEVDLISDSIQLGVELVQVGRESYRRIDRVDYEERFDELFLCSVRDENRAMRWISADIVIDATGTWGRAAGIGPGGLDPIGSPTWKTQWREEKASRKEFPLLVRRFLEGAVQREQLAGRKIAVLGQNAMALANLAMLLDLQASGVTLSLQWWLHPADPSNDADSEDPVSKARRDRIAKAVTDGCVVCRRGVQVAQMESRGTSWDIELMGEESGQVEIDVLVANTGFVGDDGPFAELQVARCPASGVPLSPVDPESGAGAFRPLAIDSLQAADLVTTEPNFYVLGAKRWGRSSGFSIDRGLDQIRSLFTLIADSPRLDLYANPPG